MSLAFDHVCARCRLASEKLFLKGEKCFTPKCPMVRRPYAPGIHGQRRRRTATEYGKQLREKQAVRAIYGIRERQMQRYVEEAKRLRGVTADSLIRCLEGRLDNAVFRLGFGASRPHARQLINHGLITVNGRTVTIPSFQVRVGENIAIKESKRGKPIFSDLAERVRAKALPPWLERIEPWAGRVADEPRLEAHEIPVDLRVVVEYYSR